MLEPLRRQLKIMKPGTLPRKVPPAENDPLLPSPPPSRPLKSQEEQQFLDIPLLFLLQFWRAGLDHPLPDTGFEKLPALLVPPTPRSAPALPQRE